MPAIARVGDRHEGTCSHGDICCPHSVSGVFTGGSPDVFANGQAIIRVGDPLEHNCPHCGTGESAQGSPDVFANGIAVSRVGDSVTYPGGGGTIVEGSPDVFVNN